jgi:YYY domain-containing protein
VTLATPGHPRHPRALVAGRWVLLAAILLVGGYLRFTGLNWDEGQWIHPDEGHMRGVTSAIEMPDSLSLYFDTHNSPLNPRNRGQRYSYGTLPLFLTRATAEWLDQGCGESPDKLSAAVGSLLVGNASQTCTPGTFTGFRSAQVGRFFSALADLGTLVLIYLIGRRLYGETVGLLAVGLGALTAFTIQQAHFFTVDSMACFFITLTAYFAVRGGQASTSSAWPPGLDLGLAGLATGLAAACKIDAALAALLVALGGLWWGLRASRALPSRAPLATLFSLLPPLFLAGLLSLVAFRLAQPYAFEGPGFFGLRPSPEWFERLNQIRVEQSGEIDLPSGRQWANRAPILFLWSNMVIWGMGLPLGLAAWAGWALAGVELLHGKHVHLVLWGWGSLIFFYQATRWVKAMRYTLPLYPLFVILAAYGLLRLCCAATRWRRRLGHGLTAAVLAGAAVWAGAVFSIYQRSHTRLVSSRWIFANVPQGATLATEHWDWPPPLRVDGYDPFGGMYRGIEMALYDEDTPEKRERLFGWLDQADYVILGSNRLYASIPRLPARYPLTTAYYRALFAGELGFELIADFTSYPSLGPFQFPDQENPFPLVEAAYTHQRQPIRVPLPPAEEAFSVYDHPRVLIFRKTPTYSRQRVEALLGGIDVERALHGLTPRQASAAPHQLEFDAQTWAEQQAGGTWSEMFDRKSLLNRYPGLAALAWWIAVTILGWLAFPLLFVALPRLRDRGYGLARVLGLLIVAYLTWLAASLHVLPNTRGTILVATLLLALAGGAVGWRKRHAMGRFVRSHWRPLLLTEGLFVLLYLAWIGVRLLHPDLWHWTKGGEKPMEFAYLNATLKSTWFPPYNPWFSGSWPNYYYFGSVFVGTLIKLLGTLPALAYNLAVPLLFALTGVGAFSVAYNLCGGRRRGALLAGGMAIVFTLLLGNLGVVHLVGGKLVALGGEPFSSTIPGLPEAVALLRGLFKVLFSNTPLPIGAGDSSWYWHPTRIIPQEAGNPITEFPAFTFLYGDLHVNMLALPLVLLALALTVNWAKSPRPRRASLLLGGLVIGALIPTHTWDYPTYLALALAGLWLGGLAGGKGRAGVKALFGRSVSLVGLTLVFYLPYLQHYAAGYTSFERWKGPRTPVQIYLLIHGVMLFPLLTYRSAEVSTELCRSRSRQSLLVEVRRLGGSVWRVREWTLPIGGAALVLALALAVLGYPVALVALPVAALAAVPLLVPGMPLQRRLLWLMVGLAMAISLAVEVFTLAGDLGRMNTVFRFYQQVWLLLAIAAAVSLARLRERVLPRWGSASRQLWWVGMAVLLFGAALFLPLGIRARAVDRIAPQAGRTLDGMAFMAHGVVYDGSSQENIREIPLSGDYAAIRWLQDHVEGSPVILEGLGRHEYLWANRVSIYTGLPAVVGWRWHQVQQRLGVLPEATVTWRRFDVDECYNTTDVSLAQEILARYGVRYVYVGEYERAYYAPVGLAKFETMAAEGLLQRVYDAQGVKIYQVKDDT